MEHAQDSSSSTETLNSRGERPEQALGRWPLFFLAQRPPAMQWSCLRELTGNYFPILHMEGDPSCFVVYYRSFNQVP